MVGLPISNEDHGTGGDSSELWAGPADGPGDTLLGWIRWQPSSDLLLEVDERLLAHLEESIPGSVEVDYECDDCAQYDEQHDGGDGTAPAGQPRALAHHPECQDRAEEEESEDRDRHASVQARRDPSLVEVDRLVQ